MIKLVGDRLSANVRFFLIVLIGFSVFSVNDVASQTSVVSEYAVKIQGVVFRRDVETFPSCLQIIVSNDPAGNNTSIEFLVSLITTCKSQTSIFEEGRTITKIFFGEFCDRDQKDWPLQLVRDDVLFACNMRNIGFGLDQRLKLINDRERTHFSEIRWLERCVAKKRRGGSCR